MADTFADNISQRIFLNENVRILIQISLKFIPRGSNDNKSALFQVMAWCWTSDKPLPQQMLTQFTDTEKEKHTYQWKQFSTQRVKEC